MKCTWSHSQINKNNNYLDNTNKGLINNKRVNYNNNNE